MAHASPPPLSAAGRQPSYLYAAPSGGGTSSDLYGLAQSVPLLKAPVLRVPPKPTLPVSQLHPLPLDLAPYFAYDFGVEAYALGGIDPSQNAARDGGNAPIPPPGGPSASASTPASQRAALAAARHAAEAYLSARTSAREARETARLRKAAPGWGGGASVLMPTSSAAAKPKSTAGGATGAAHEAQAGSAAASGQEEKPEASQDPPQEEEPPNEIDQMAAMLDKLEQLDGGAKKSEAGPE